MDVIAVLRPSKQLGSLGRLGHYELLEVIGRGAMGLVFKALDTHLQRTVAIKVMSNSSSSGRWQDRFMREAQAVAAIRHENVVTIHAVDADQNLMFLVMEYVEGSNLQEQLDAGHIFTPEQILSLGIQIAEGLAQAHRQGLIHRDVKPNNILLSGNPTQWVVKITDFGLVRTLSDPAVTHPGTLLGTPAYMSPEQATGKSLDQRSDLFSLGSVLYALCTGQPPFPADDVMAVLHQVAEAKTRPVCQVNPEVPFHLGQLIEKLHAIVPGRRPESADAVVKQLKAIRLGKPSSLLRSKYRNRNRVLIALGLLIVAAILVPQVIIRLRDKDGKTSIIEVPAGKSLSIESNGKVLANIPASGVVPGEIRRFEGHIAFVHSVALSGDGRKAISGSWDHTVRLSTSISNRMARTRTIIMPMWFTLH